MAEWRNSSTILGLGTRWRWVVSFTSHPGRFTPGENAPCTQWIRVWTLWSRRKSLARAGESKPGRPARHYIDWAMPTPLLLLLLLLLLLIIIIILIITTMKWGEIIRPLHDRFFSNPFPFIIHQSSDQSTLYSLIYWQCRKTVHNNNNNNNNNDNDNNNNNMSQ
jgi:hypothetical protein